MADLRYNLDVPGTEQLIDVDNTVRSTIAKNKEIVLIPQPTSSPADPLRWGRLKKSYQLFLLALYACIFSFTENGMGAAWTTISEETGVTLTNMNGGSALNYLLLGFGNILWISTAMKIGRRPVFLMSTIIVLATAVWQGKFHGTGQWMAAMVVNGVGTSAYNAIVQLSIFDTFYIHQRGRMLAIYLFGQQLGSILGLITGGITTDHLGWRQGQINNAYIATVLVTLFFFTFEESLFPRWLFNVAGDTAPTSDSAKAQELENDGVDEEKPTDTSAEVTGPSPDIPERSYLQKLKPWVNYDGDTTTFWQYCMRPFMLFTFPNVVVAGIIYAFGCTAGIVSFNTVSEIFTEPPYNFSNSATGLIFLAALIGDFVGLATGSLTDFVILRLARRNKGIKEPEMRLWMLCVSSVYALVGYMMYGWGAHYGLHWAVVAFGLGCMIAHQVSACSIATAYAMESFPGIGGELVVLLAICSSCINFAISYSVQPFIERTGYGYAFLFFGLCVFASMIAAIPIYIRGKRMRMNAAPRWKAWMAQKNQSMI